MRLMLEQRSSFGTKKRSLVDTIYEKTKNLFRSSLELEDNKDMPFGEKWPFYPSAKTPLAWNIGSRITIRAVAFFGKFMVYCNRFTVHNRAGFQRLIESRPQGKPLLTVSNHKSCIDDPVVHGILPWRLLKKGYIRWVPAAKEICFNSEPLATFFSLGQCVPVIRGDGVYQKAMDFLVERLNAGDWVHINPEGKVNLTSDEIRLKWGVGRLIADSRLTPTVLPIWHIGMDDVLPNRSPYIPRLRKRVTVLIGQPLEFGEVVSSLRRASKTPREIRKFLTDEIQREFSILKLTAEKFHTASS